MTDDVLHGLPGPLPPGESIRYLGRPRFGALARNLFHVRAVAAYFALLAGWAAVLIAWHGAPVGNALLAAAIAVVPLALAAVGLLLALAWLVARTTTYFVTDRRVILLIGVAITKMVNIPLARIAGIAVREQADGTADVEITLGPGKRIGYLMLFPHTRGRRPGAPRPMLRGLADGMRAADVLADALLAAQGGVRHAVEPRRASVPEARGVEAPVAG